MDNKIFEEFNKFDETDLILLVKVMCNNPLVDFQNAITLTLQKLDCQFREPKDNKVDDFKKENIIEYFNNNDSYKFVKTTEKKLDSTLSLNKMKDKWFTKTNIKVYVNCEVDDTKKNAFINDNVLWLSDMINDNLKAYYIVKTYADICIPKDNLSIKTLIHIFIDYFFYGKEFRIPKVIYYTEKEVLYVLFRETFEYFKKVLFCFIKRFVNLNDLINILNNDLINVNIEENELPKIIYDCKQDYLPDFPYYFY